MAARRDVNASSRPSGLQRGADDVLAWLVRRRGGAEPSAGTIQNLALAPVLGLDDERAHERHVAAVGRHRGVADGLHPVVVPQLDLTRGWLGGGGRDCRTTIATARNSGRVMRTSAERRRKCVSLPHRPRGAQAWRRRPEWGQTPVYKAKKKGIRWSGCPSSPRRTAAWACWDVWTGRAARSMSGRAHAAARVEHHCVRRAIAGRRWHVQASGLWMRRQSAPGVGTPSAGNGPSARPRVARWITARDDCHVRPPFRTGALRNFLAHPAPSPQRRVMNLPARYPSTNRVSSLSSRSVTETTAGADQLAPRKCLTPHRFGHLADAVRLKLLPPQQIVTSVDNPTAAAA